MSDTGNAVYEHEVQGTTEKHLHYAGGQALAVHTVQTGTSPQTKTEYLHRDHLGSVEAVSNASGVAVTTPGENHATPTGPMARQAAHPAIWALPAMR